MKKTILRFVSTALAVFMLFGSMNIGVFAADMTDGQNNATDSTKDFEVNVAIDSATLASLVADALTAAEKAVLNHSAVKKAVTTLFEDAVDSKINVTVTGEFYVTVKAESITTEIGTWTPVRVVVDGDTKNLDANGSVSFVSFAGTKDIEVIYTIDVAEGSAADTLAKLPTVLATEAKAQKDVLDIYLSLRGKLERFGDYSSLLKTFSTAVWVDKSVRDALTLLFDEGIEKDEKTLVIYNYLGQYEKDGLVYLYTKNNAEKFIGQVELLKNVFNTLYADQMFIDMFTGMANTPEMKDYVDMLDSIKDALNSEEYQLTPVNAAIDTKGDVATLVDLLLANVVSTTAPELTVSGIAKVEVNDSEEPEVPVDPPVDPEEPVDPPVDPEEPVDPPVDPEEPVDPPVDPEEPVDPPVDPEEPVDPPVVPEAPKTITIAIGGVDFRVSYTGNAYQFLLPAPESAGDYFTYEFGDEVYEIPGGMEDFVYGEYDSIEDLISGILGDNGYDIDDEVIGGIIDDVINGDIDIGDLGDLGDLENGDIFEDIFDEIFGDEISREDDTIENLRRKDLLALINAVNNAVASVTMDNGTPVMTFIPVEDANGNISVVLRVTPFLNGIDYKELVMQAVFALIANQYESIELGGKPVFTGFQFYLQNIMDLFLSDGFGMEAIGKMIDAKGDIVDITKTVATLKDVTLLEGCELEFDGTLGGKLIASKMNVTDGSLYEAEFDFYVTFEDYDTMASKLIAVDNAISAIGKYITITGEDGSLNVTFRVPAKLTAYYLAELLVLDYADITDIDSMDFEGSVNFILSLIKPLLADQNLTLDTFENTFEKAGIYLDLSKFMSEEDFAMIRKILNSLIDTVEFEADEDNNKKANVSENYSIGAIVDKVINKLVADAGDDPMMSMMVGMLKNIIAEADGVAENGEGITIKASIEDVTFEKNNVQAIVLDPSVVMNGSVSDIVNNPKDYISVLHTTSNLADTLANAAPNTVVVLLKDVELSSDVVISNRVFLNLNGFEITGNMTAKGAVRITNSNLTDNGGVNGKLSGNFVITGGAYDCDVTSMLAKGYEVRNGAVVNTVYTVKEDAEGNVTIALNASSFKKSNIPAVKEFLADVAFDVALNVFTMASLSVDGNNIYNIELYDLVGMLDSSKKDIAKDIYSCVNFEGITAVANTILEDVTDFGALAEAIANDKAFASYEITTKSWGFTTGIAGEDDKYLTVNLVPKNPKTVTLSFVVDEVTGDSAKAAIVALLKGFADTVDIDASINLGGFGYNNGDVSVDLTGKVNVLVDFSADGRYGLVIATAVAYAAKDHRAELVKAINVAVETGEYGVLADALDKVSVGDFIDALKALGKTSFANMLNALGLNIGADNAEVIALEAVYGKVLNIAGRLLNYFEISGGYSKLLGYTRTDSENEARYEFARQNVYGFDVAFTLVLFDEETVFDSEITVEVGTSAKLYGSKIVLAGEDQKYIVLDALCAGITVGELKAVISSNVNAVLYVYGANGEVKEDDALVVTTDRLVVEANNNSAEYGLVVLGDMNGDGQNDKSDAKALANYIVGNGKQNDFLKYAADVFGTNSEINAGDVAKLVAKFSATATYESCLGQ